LINVSDLQAFSGFLKLSAGRTVQEINLSTLGSDAGVSHNTARVWLSVLETSYITYRLPAWHVNIRKQIVKTPKLHFFDSGLACYLLGIREPEQLRIHPLRGAIFESWAVSEIYKACIHMARQPSLFHYRAARGPKIDLLIDQGDDLLAVEIKSGATITKDFFKNLTRFSNCRRGGSRMRSIQNCVVYGGDDSQIRSGSQVLSWRDIQRAVE
jgi:predicted AAA+ superfamily ATPase